MAESEGKLLERIRQWKDGVELKGLRVNMGKTKVMKCKVRQGQADNSGKFPCGICRKGVARNSIMLYKMEEVDPQKGLVGFGIDWNWLLGFRALTALNEWLRGQCLKSCVPSR